MRVAPQVPNFGRPGTGPERIGGLGIAIVPRVSAGGQEVGLGDGGWAFATRGGCVSAHWERTVAVRADGPRILTLAA
jgi:methionyl aminopeptidase